MLTEAEYKSECQITNYTPYLARQGELWGVFCEDLVENWPRYNGTTLQFITQMPMDINTLTYLQIAQLIDHYVTQTDLLIIKVYPHPSPHLMPFLINTSFNLLQLRLIAWMPFSLQAITASCVIKLALQLITPSLINVDGRHPAPPLVSY